jgi:hypothetical protein
MWTTFIQARMPSRSTKSWSKNTSEPLIAINVTRLLTRNMIISVGQIFLTWIMWPSKTKPSLIHGPRCRNISTKMTLQRVLVLPPLLLKLSMTIPRLPRINNLKCRIVAGLQLLHATAASFSVATAHYNSALTCSGTFTSLRGHTKRSKRVRFG